ncbi:proline-rich domain-containing protein [Actinoplanes awajinensis]|uniref:proline-rich domain-containing protein n=1 Tax=Actinoplanes awajinensis TaxID=135946 RepID=UPI0012FAE0AA|nr:proline-rich domain-containing protein [Actinoplanes awajinensis]
MPPPEGQPQQPPVPPVGWPQPQDPWQQPPAPASWQQQPPPPAGWQQQPPPPEGWQQQAPPPGWQQQPAPPGWPQQAVPQQGGWPPQPPQQGWQPPLTPPPPVVPAPPREPKKSDRLAVAAGSASFLSVGYFMARRGGWGFLTLIVSFVLLFFVVPSVHTVLIEIVAVLWWLAMIVHGFFLAKGPVEPAAKLRQRGVGIAAAVAALLVLGLLRVQAGGIGQTVADAKASGDCQHAMDSLDKVWLGLRIADAPLAAEGDDTVSACRELTAAGTKLTDGLSGDVTDLNTGFNQIGTVLATRPGHEKMADAVVDGFLAGLPVQDPCTTVTITDWITKRPKTGNTLDRSVEAVAKHEPAALLGCGDKHMAAEQWTSAKASYQSLIQAYPADAGKAKAVAGIAKADLAIELATVREKLEGTGTNSQPAYCGSPAKYSAAKAYGKGVNKALFFGNDTESGRLPKTWSASDVTNATLVVCIGDDTRGASVQSCSYRSNFGTGPSYKVTFHKVKVAVKAYEIRTGRVVFNKTMQFGGSSCPSTVSYTSTLGSDLGPPSHMDVKVNAKDVKTQFQKFVVK